MFGVASSPFLAVRVLQQMAADHKEQFSKAAHTISICFYVDDVLAGAVSPREAAQLRRDLCELLSCGRMTLRKWKTNSTNVLETVPEELREKTTILICTDSTVHPKTLGLHWDFTYSTRHRNVPFLESLNGC